MGPMTPFTPRFPGRPVRRAALLVLSLLSACAANDFGFDSDSAASRFKPTGAFGAYLSGRFAVQQSDMDVAAQKLEEAAKDSGMREVSNQAFIAAVLAGRAEASRLAESLPENPVAQLVLADEDVKAGRWDNAEARFSGLSQQQGLTQALRPIVIAWAQAGQGRTAAALGTLAPFVEAGRLRGVMALHAALVADLGGQTAEAARLYRLAQAEYGGTNLRLGVLLASWQARSGAMTEAQRTIREVGGGADLGLARLALEADVSNRAVRNAADGIAEAYLAMGATLRQQDAQETAQIMLRLALSMRPDFTAARLLLADMQDAARRPKVALDTLAPVAASDPLAAVVQLRRAALYDSLGQTDTATQVLETLAREFPDRPEPLTLEADILRRKSRFQEAAAMYDRAIGRIGVPSRANWPLFYERGVARERAGQWKAAESDFQFALQLAPEQPAVLNYLGYAWTERGEHLDEARRMIQRAVEQRPNDGSFVDSLGWLMLRQGDGPGALKNLQRAVELVPEDAVINGHLGDALAAVGRWREAEFQWRRALTLKPDPEEAERITAKLAALPSPAATQAAAPGATVR
jgi:tetratricopeptide (TPR) repeat protein